MRSTFITTFIALAVASPTSFSDQASSASDFDSFPPSFVADEQSQYLAHYAPFQLARLATFRASRGGDDGPFTEAQDALLSRVESAVAAGNISEITAVSRLCVGTFGVAGCAALAGVEDGTCDGGTVQQQQLQRIHGRDGRDPMLPIDSNQRPQCTCSGIRQPGISETCFCVYRRNNCIMNMVGCGFFQALYCRGMCAPNT